MQDFFTPRTPIATSPRRARAMCSSNLAGGHMRVVSRVVVFWAVVLVASATQLFAQTGFANMVDHIHLAVPDPTKGVEWYRKHFNGQPMTEGPDRLMFGDVRII